MMGVMRRGGLREPRPRGVGTTTTRPTSSRGHAVTSGTDTDSKGRAMPLRPGLPSAMTNARRPGWGTLSESCVGPVGRQASRSSLRRGALKSQLGCLPKPRCRVRVPRPRAGHRRAPIPGTVARSTLSGGRVGKGQRTRAHAHRGTRVAVHWAGAPIALRQHHPPAGPHGLTRHRQW